MQCIHTFRRDRTCQIIRCNPWSTRLHLHPTLIKKMKTYLELEGKLGPKPKQPHSQQNQPRPTQPSTNPLSRRGKKTNGKRRKLIPTRWYKVWVVAKPIPTPKADNMTTQTPETIPITMMNLSKGKSQEIPPQGGSSADNNPHHLKISQLEQALHGLEQGQYQKTCLSQEKTGQPPHNKSRSTAPLNTNPMPLWY